MRLLPKFKISALMIMCNAVVWPATVQAEDIDIFAGAAPGGGSNANVLVVMDNRSQWTGATFTAINGTTKFAGQMDLDILSDVAQSLNSNISIGLMMLSKNPIGMTKKEAGGWVRFAMTPMDLTGKNLLAKNLAAIWPAHSSFEVPDSDNDSQLDNVFMDAFKYYGGYTSPVHATDDVDGAPLDSTHFGPIAYTPGTLATGPAGSADPRAYTDGNLTTYVPPASPTGCAATNYIIFIANPNSDLQTSGTASLLTNVGGSTTNPSHSYPPYLANWASFLNKTDVNAAPGQQKIVTYVIVATKDNSNVDTAIGPDMARYGGGRFFKVTDERQLKAAFTTIFDEIQAVNSTFASASLPINATDRRLNENEVYIGMFRPNTGALPRWFGNIKRYQLINSSSDVVLGDSLGQPAVNPLTGFVTNCAVSYWTTDSGTYWNTATYTPTPKGQCSSSTNSPYSDAPDGPIVEKGGAAEVIRKGNNPPATNTSPTYVPAYSSYRKMYTLSGSSLVPLTTANTGLTATQLNWVLGQDVNRENATNPAPAAGSEPTRFSLHGDVVHSRPYVASQKNLSTPRSTVYYGANDGQLRAVDTETGKERWSFMPPESFSKMARLIANSPLIAYPGVSTLPPDPSPTPKDYFMDGPISAFQSSDPANPANNNANIWIYAAQRRGGRQIFSFDVSNPDSPLFKWRVGCTTAADTSCTGAGATPAANMSLMGQTWSTPNVAFIKGYKSGLAPVVVLGGGYDPCEDADSSTPACTKTATSPKGSVVYVLDGSDGSLVATFRTDRSVIADVALVDVDNDGFVDYAYAADTGGQLYRISFVSNPYAPTAITDPTQWTIRPIAYTTGSGRKFQNAPALLPVVSRTNGYAKVYVALGTGDREKPLQTQYPYPRSGNTGVINRFYVYLDDLNLTSSSTPTPTPTNLDTSTTIKNFTTPTACGDPGVVPSDPTYNGWFIDLSGTGEQTVTSAVIVSGMLTFSTNRPTPAPPNSCAPNLGEARGYWLNLTNGSGSIGVAGSCGGARYASFIGGGLPPSPVISTVNVGGKNTTVVIGAIDRKGGVSSAIQAQQVSPAIRQVRRPSYWYKNSDN